VIIGLQLSTMSQLVEKEKHLEPILP
jgi:hypothetical protein